MKKVFTTGQVAKICKVAPRTVSKWFDSGRLRGYRIPGSQDRRIPREHLLRFLKEHGMPLGDLEAEVYHKILVVGADAPLLGSLREQLRELEAMTHPAIVNRIAAIAGETHDLVVEIPLMLQIPGDWTTIYVDAHPDRRVRRAVDRGLDEANVRRRMGNQPRRWEWLAWADLILENNGTPAELAERVDELWKELQLR